MRNTGLRDGAKRSRATYAFGVLISFSVSFAARRVTRRRPAADPELDFEGGRQKYL